MTTVFLLGSGISIDAEMPSVSAITDRVTTGDGVWRYTDGSYVLGTSAAPAYDLYRPPVESVLILVDELRRRARDYLTRAPNYEEIAQFAQQIEHALPPGISEYENPAVMPLVAELLAQVTNNGDEGHLELKTRAEAAGDYISDIVHGMLRKPAARLDHLGVLVDACRRLNCITLATLNHDLVLEAALDAAGIRYADGFERRDADVRKWADEWNDSPLRLLKLHGSIDWWRYQFADEAWRGSVATRYSGSDPKHPTRRGIVGGPFDPRPLFLVGTFDKILSYETSLFLDQHLRFREDLRDARRVVVIGYGFADKAINSRLIGWLARDRENRMVVCHPEPTRLVRRARGAIRTAWDRWQENEQLAIVPAYVGDLVFADVAVHLD